MAIFSEIDVGGKKRPDKMLMDCPVYTGQGADEQGIKEFKLNKDAKLAAGGYFILVIWSDSPGSSLDYKSDTNGSTYYVGSQNFDTAFEKWTGPTMSYNDYSSNWSYWVKAKTLGGERSEIEGFVKAMDDHLKPSDQKSYFPPKPDGWDELDEKQACFQLICELGLVHAQKYMIEQFFNKCTEGRLCDKEHQLVNVGKTMDDGWICSATKDKGGACKRNCVVEEGKGKTAGWTRYWCDKCDFNLCDLCWEKKIDINFLGADGLAPLHAAAFHGQLPVASALIESKANLQVRTGDALIGTSRTPLMLAALGNASTAYAVLELLLSKGAEIDAEDSVGSNALQLAATRGGPLAAAPLLKTKIQVDHQDQMGYSAILNAAHYGQPDVFSMLVKQKASLKLHTKEGMNAMHLCIQHNQAAVLQRLLDAEAFSLMEEKDNAGATPLDVATEMRNPEILSLMAAACAGLGRAVNIGAEAGDGARHLNEANKICCTRVVPQYPNTSAAHVGIHWDASNDWKGEGEIMAAVFAEGADGEPDFTKCLAECKGKVNATENRGKTVYYPLLKPVPLTKAVGYWVAFSTTMDTIVEKDSRIKLMNRRYAQHDFKEGWKNLPKVWKKNLCTPAVFIRTAAKEAKK
jgi:serine/threonine-protein phosphatase 6 regulatory ankyrin repeat subunit B